MNGLEFDIVLEKQKEGGYTAYVPSLPGCISQGETKKETLKNIKEAIELYLEEIDKSKLNDLIKDVSIVKTNVKTHA